MWILALFAVCIVLYLSLRHGPDRTLYYAAQNAFLAKITWPYLTQETKDIATSNINKLLIANRFESTLDDLEEVVAYSLIAMELYGSGIDPYLRGYKWTYLPNPVAPARCVEQGLIDSMATKFKRESGIDVIINTRETCL